MSQVKQGATDQSVYVKLVSSASGAPQTGLTIANIDATYVRTRAAAVKNDLTALASASAAHADNQAIEVDATNAPGLYRIDFPDAAFAAGADKVILSVTCAACDPAMKEIELVANNAEDVFGRIGAPAGASLAADVAAVKAQTQAIETDTQDIQARLPAALVSGRIDASVGAMAADTLTATALSADAATEIRTGLSTLDAAGVRGAIGLASANLDTQLDALPTNAELAARTLVAADYATAAAVAVVDAVADAIQAKTDALPSDPADQSLIIAATDAVMARLGAPAGASVSADIAAVKGDTAATLQDTGTDGVVVAGASKTGYRLSADGVNDLLRTALTEGYAAEGAAMTLEQALHMLVALLFNRSVSGTTLTTRRLDGATPAMTFTLDDADAPTSQVRAT